jgi:uncharacterized protein
MTAVALDHLPYVDGHMHPPLRPPPREPDEYRWPWYEGSADETALAGDLAAYRWGVRQLATYLGCAPAEEAVIAAVAERDPAAWLREVAAAGDVAGLVLDTGYPPPDTALTWEEVRDAAGVDVAALLRLEHHAGELAAQAGSFDELVDRYDAAVRGARARGYAGLKSIIAYRSGLGVDPAANAAGARAGFAREKERAGGEGPLRLADKALLDFLLLRALAVAREEELPVQFHAGYGDRDLDLVGTHPRAIRPLLDSGAADGVAVVLLHGCYPYTGEGAVVASIYGNVYLDVATCIPPIGWGALVETWRTALAVAPLSRIHASSDAAGLAEQILLGAWRARATLGVALGELLDQGALGADECEAVAADILAGTSRRVYFGAGGSRP